MFRCARHREELPHLLRCVLRTGRRYKAPQLVPVMETSPGVFCSTRADFLAHAGRHFAQAERARPSHLARLPALYGGHNVAAMLDVTQLPTVDDLSRAFSRLKSGRAPGITGLVPEVYKSSPDLAALSHWPLALKAVSAGTQPLLWMGGVAKPIPKPTKSPAAMSGWRSILLQECSGKAVASALRGRLLQGLERQAPAGMAGARRGVPLTLPCHLVGRHLDTLRQNAANGAILFVDGEAAFYATVRCFLDPKHGHYALDDWIDSLHTDAYLTDAIKAILRTHDVLEAGGIAFAVRDALRCSISSSWYTALPSEEEIYEAVTGTVPGAPLADLLFQLTFVLCLQQVTERLSEFGHCARLPGTDPCEVAPCSHPTWMDDVALLLQSPVCTDVAPALAHAASAMQAMLGATGIAMNLLPGKTEGLVVLHGGGSRAERHRLFIDLDGKLPFGDCNSGHLCLTDTYVHLGVLVGAQCMAAKHIERRARFAELSFAPLRRRLLPNPHLSACEKRELLRSFVVGRLMHGLEQWTLEADKDFRCFQTAYMGFLRRSIRPVTQCSSACLRDDQVCAILEFLTPREAHAMALTRSLSQVLHSGMSYLLGLLYHQSSWLRCSLRAVNFVLSILGADNVPALPDSFADFAVWQTDTKQRIGQVSLLLRRFCRSVIQSRKKMAEHALAHAEARNALVVQGVVLQHIPDELEDRPRTIVCPLCCKHFATVAAQGAHARRVHGKIALHTQSLRGTACQVCMREYWTSARLREHLRFSSSCCHTYIGADLGDILPQEKGCSGQAGATCRPITVLTGPQPWWATLHPAAPSDALPHMPPDTWLEQELRQTLAQFREASPAMHHCALKSVIRLHSLASGDLGACLDDFVYSIQDSYWHSILAASSKTLSAEHRGTEQPCSAGIVQLIGRWLMLRPSGLLVDTSCLLDGA